MEIRKIVDYNENQYLHNPFVGDWKFKISSSELDPDLRLIQLRVT